MERNRPPLDKSQPLRPRAGLAERVVEVQQRAAQAGFGPRSGATSEADKAFMDEMWGEDSDCGSDDRSESPAPCGR